MNKNIKKALMAMGICMAAVWAGYWFSYADIAEWIKGAGKVSCWFVGLPAGVYALIMVICKG